VCILCSRQAPPFSLFCGPCANQARGRGPEIIEIPAGHSSYKSVENQFTTSWRHTNKTRKPPVKKIYKILVNVGSLTSYENYRSAVEARGQFVSAGKLGDQGCTRFCSDAACSLCSIIRRSFDISLFGKKTGWGRFGKGIYTTSTSSKCVNDFG
jgi:hypothetical protein